MQTPCDLCGVTTGTEIEPKVFVCDGCGFVHVKERRSPAEIAAAWSEVYQSGAYDPYWPGVKARLFYVAEWLDQKYGLKGKSVLDIGAGKGLFLDYARDLGAIVSGVEPDPDNASIIRQKNIPCMNSTIEDALISTKYDIVTILWTLENCGDCLDFLKHARKFLKDDGILVVVTGSRILVPYKKPYSSYFGNQPPDLHCYRWSFRSLNMALDKAGFKIAQVNDLEQRDEMIAVAKRGGEHSVYREDDPATVVKFFRDWKETFP